MEYGAMIFIAVVLLVVAIVIGRMVRASRKENRLKAEALEKRRQREQEKRSATPTHVSGSWNINSGTGSHSPSRHERSGRTSDHNRTDNTGVSSFSNNNSHQNNSGGMDVMTGVMIGQAMSSPSYHNPQYEHPKPTQSEEVMRDSMSVPSRDSWSAIPEKSVESWSGISDKATDSWSGISDTKSRNDGGWSAISEPSPPSSESNPSSCSSSSCSSCGGGD